VARAARAIRYSDIAPSSQTAPRYQQKRPSCFGRQYDPADSECRLQCSHKSACAPIFRQSHGARVPSKAHTAAVAERDPTESLPEYSEILAPDESFWAKLAFNSALQAVESVVHEMHFAIRSVPRKEYF